MLYILEQLPFTLRRFSRKNLEKRKFCVIIMDNLYPFISSCQTTRLHLHRRQLIPLLLRPRRLLLRSLALLRRFPDCSDRSLVVLKL